MCIPGIPRRSTAAACGHAAQIERQAALSNKRAKSTGVADTAFGGGRVRSAKGVGLERNDCALKWRVNDEDMPKRNTTLSVTAELKQHGVVDPARRRDFLKASAALAAAAAAGGAGWLGMHAAHAQTVRVKPPPVKPLRRAQTTTIEFVEGVPARVSVASLLPTGADRYHGGYYDMIPGSSSVDDHIQGLSFDPATRELVYDGSPLSANSYNGTIYAANPNTSYFIGAETGPYNAHWQYPPTAVAIPQPKTVAGVPVQQGITNQCKHTRPRFCPLDGKVHIFGGDYSSVGLLGPPESPQNGRMLMWNLDPVSGVWGLDYPPRGRAGENMPLSSDLMGYAWDDGRKLWWVMFGSSRPGYTSDAAWKADGGLANAWPADANDPGPLPVFVFDPKLAQPRYTLLPVKTAWPGTEVIAEIAYDEASKRIYAMEPGSNGVLVHWLDTTPYDSDPARLAWQSVTIDLSLGSASNLTGTGDHRFAVGMTHSPMHVDDSTRRLYFLDSRRPAVLALTLPGHPQGEHKVQLVANLPGMPDMSTVAQGLTACASSPFMWVPEHRSLVLLCEPVKHQVGPQTNSYTIDADSGTVSEGPRYPTRPDGRPWFPNAGVWFPPTQELMLYAFIEDDTGGGPIAVPQTFVRYKWIG